MGLVVTALRAALTTGLATSMAKGSPQLYWTLTDGISSVITQTVTVTLRVLMRRSVYCGW
ncbi:VirB6 protein [Xanthomonas arboricola pv. fragariae]|nr:VirB6 protein [Xanthomonas arboricola pv. fragariae]